MAVARVLMIPFCKVLQDGIIFLIGHNMLISLSCLSAFKILEKEPRELFSVSLCCNLALIQVKAVTIEGQSVE